MTRVSDIMTPDPITVEPGMSLREAVEVLRGAGVSGAPVVRGGRLVGVVSTTDILELEATSPGIPPRRPERVDWGERDRETPEDESPEEFPSAFFIDFWADSGGDVWNRVSETDTPEWDRLEEHTVEEVMSRDLVTVAGDASASEAARSMLERKVHRVIVVEDADPVGLLSAFDLRAVLHAVRDRLTAEEAAHLGSQLPMLVRGFYFEGWRPALAPNDFDTADAFFSRVEESLGGTAVAAEIDVRAGTRVVMEFLAEEIDPGELRHVTDQLPSEIEELFPAPTA